MEVICSICRCAIGRNPPEGSTDLADICKELCIPDPQDGPQIVHHNAPNIVSTPCGHLFHNSCLTQWYLMIGNRRCPLCNFVTPVHRMVRIFPTIDKSADTTGNTPKSELSTTEFHLTPPNPGAQGDSVGENVETPGVDNAIASTSTAFLDQSSSPAADEETQEAGEQQQVPLQVTETSLNGIRTMIYHFRPNLHTTTSDMINELLAANASDQQGRNRGTSTGRRETADKIRNSRQCNGCANYSRIQALMTNDIQDLRNLVSEQEAKIQSLENAIRIGSFDSSEHSQACSSVTS